MKRIAAYCLVALPLLLAATALLSFSSQNNERIKGNGNVKQESREASAFTDISTSGVYKVIIEQGNTHSIRVEAEDNLLPYIVTDISRGELSIHSKKGYNIQPTKEVRVYITLQKVDKLSASGASGFTSKGKLTSDRLRLDFSGAADVNLDIRTHELKVGVSGASNVTLKGNTDKADYGISGAADISALDLATDEAKLGISGTGKANVFVQKSLNIAISGMGHVKYKGDPSITQSISGMGKI
ncbi:head GIN domain-containing protein, partial [Chitinophaga sp.]|uniref:head GIN domain-containing protein n=1 Tax=Chitinophaga sp. TaxID=1869181 RepID=UPI002C548EED